MCGRRISSGKFGIRTINPQESKTIGPMIVLQTCTSRFTGKAGYQRYLAIYIPIICLEHYTPELNIELKLHYIGSDNNIFRALYSWYTEY